MTGISEQTLGSKRTMNIKRLKAAFGSEWKTLSKKLKQDLTVHWTSLADSSQENCQNPACKICNPPQSLKP